MWHSFQPEDIKFLLLLMVDLILMFLLGTVLFHVTFLDTLSLILISYIACILIIVLSE